MVFFFLVFQEQMIVFLAVRGHATVWRDASDKVVKRVQHPVGVRFQQWSDADLDSMRTLPRGFAYETRGPNTYRVLEKLLNPQAAPRRRDERFRERTDCDSNSTTS